MEEEIKNKNSDCKQEQCKQENCNCKQEQCEQEKCDCKQENCEHEECNEKKEHCKKHEKCDKEKEELNNKIKELTNELLVKKADFINYRKRLEDEQSRILKFCNEDLIKEVLPILDNFERAINMDDKNLDDEVSKFLSGFKMIYCSLVNVLKSYGVIEIDGNNKPFDPNYHEAIMTEKREDMESGMVIDVLQKGYILKGKVIRPAMVKVSE